jgi:Ca2+-transporting ATPase
VRQNALVRKLPAVETLGSVTFICSDKTGTLTLNKMTVEEMYDRTMGSGVWNFNDKEILSRDSGSNVLFRAMALSNDSTRGENGTLIGDPTETAIFEAAEKAGYVKEEIEKSFSRVREIPFDSDRKRMTTFHSSEEGSIVSFTKGALESILEQSDNILTNEGIKNLDEGLRNKIVDASQKMANDGLRTLAFAMREWESLPEDITSDNAESGLTFLGMTGLVDPPRDEAREAVATCKSAGIKPVMITGDHPLTAKTIAKRLGILEDRDSVLTGQELSKLSLDEFEQRVEEIRVYARVAPEQKIKIIKALQDKGEFAAMTGDGVNDAPALKRADIGIAMGITGTDVSKEAAHMILLDDNFATIVKAVKEGRRIFDNIRKFIKYTMTSNSGEIWTIFLAPFLGLPIPLLPIHILWVNLVTDGLPGLAYAMEPAEKNIMKRPPRHPQENIFTGMWSQIIWIGLLMGGLCIFTQSWAISSGRDQAHWQTMVFTVLCLSQMGNAFSIRSERESFFSLGLFSNKSMLSAVLLTFVLQMAVIYVPFLNPIFKTAPLSLFELTITLLISTIVFIAVETEKWWLRRNYNIGITDPRS